MDKLDELMNTNTGSKPVEKNTNTEPKSLSQTPAVSAGGDRISFTDEQIKDWLFGNIERSSSNVCCAIYGHDGTAKSGIAMDCRTEQEKKEGWKIVIFDLDGGCAPLKVIYHENDKNIIIKNPQVRNELGNLDYEGTFTKLKSALDFIERNLSTMKIKAIIFDGIDKFLKICEYSMREDLNKEVTDGINYLYWKLRNQKYHDVLEQIKLMDVDRFFITHLKKDEEKDKAGNVLNSSWNPDWEKKTGDMVYQKLLCFKEIKIIDGNKVVQMKAKIEKCKTNLAFEGREFIIAETIIEKDGGVKAKWNGLYFNKDNTIVQKK
jgi:hypothetical protein